MNAVCRPTSPAEATALLDDLLFAGSHGIVSPAVSAWPGRCAYAVAIPARQEERRIGACLSSVLASMHASGRPGGIVLLVNNTTDATAARAAALLADSGAAHLVLDVALPDAMANAGTARRLALDVAAAHVDPLGALLTTDADTIVGRDWIGASLAALDRGADVVCGAIDVDPEEAAPILARMGPGYLSEADYVAQTIALGALLDPLPHDPFPPHRCAGGASLAVRHTVYRDTGGIPPLASGEDRAFVATAEARDCRIVYSAAARVTTAFRLTGRASGGMAETLAERLRGDDAPCDDVVEPAATAAWRAWARGRLRAVAGGPAHLRAGILSALGLDPADDPFAATPFFGEAWSIVEARSPRLVRRRLSLARVAAELPALHALVGSLRAGGEPPLTAADAERWIARTSAREPTDG
ncbi:glycosyltransferase [Amorphus sp. MBR-141]